MSLEDYKPYLTSIATGLAGSAAGGGLSYLNTKQEDDETPEDFAARRRQNTITGAVGGGSVGLAAPVVASRLSTLFNNKDSLVGNILGNLGGKTLQTGGGAAGGAVAGGLVGRGLQGKENAASQIASRRSQIAGDVEGVVKAFPDKSEEAIRQLNLLKLNHFDSLVKRYNEPSLWERFVGSGAAKELTSVHNVPRSAFALEHGVRAGSAVGAVGAIAAPWLLDKYMGD